MSEVKQVTIIGTGLIGGSLGMAFKNLQDPPKVIGFSRTLETMKKAIQSGAIDEYKAGITAAVQGSDIVFICAPVSKITEIAQDASKHMEKGAVLTDVGSTKSAIVKNIEKEIPKDVNFIGGHPMAGSENYGIENADENLFKGSQYILTPTEKTNTKSFEVLHRLLTDIGANVIAIKAEKHDKIVSSLSHIPHLAASSLVNLVDTEECRKENWVSVAAGGFKDMTRIAASNPELWLDICLENKDAILKTLDDYKNLLTEIGELINKKDREAIGKWLEKARNARISMVPAIERDLAQFRDLLIEVKDKPGVISDITLTIGGIGLNIENIEIVPIDEKSGSVRVSLIGAEGAQKAADALKEKGYSVTIKALYNDSD